MSTTTATTTTATTTAMTTARAARAELFRLRKWPAVWVTLGAWLALSIMFGYLFNYLSYTSGDSSFANEGATRATLLAEMMPANVADVFVQGMPMFGGALMLVLGAIVAGNGYGWGTWKTVFSLGVHRSGAILGSMGALTVFVVATLATSFVFDLGLSVLVATTESQDIVMPSLGSVAEAAGAGFLVLEMWALIGFALGTIARGPALSVGLGLVWALLVENLLRGVGQLLDWVDTLTMVLPGTAGGSLIGSIVGLDGADTAPGILDTVSGPKAAITVACYIVAAAMVSIIVVRRRDVA
jgi:ABC-2 type transport system permease protein